VAVAPAITIAGAHAKWNTPMNTYCRASNTPKRMASMIKYILAALLFVSPAHAGRGNLDGWGDVKFGMTFDEADRATGGVGQKKKNILGQTTLIWQSMMLNSPVEINVIFGAKARVTSIVIVFDIAHDCSSFPDPRFVDALASKYGKPDSTIPFSTSSNTTKGATSMFLFDNGASIKADAGLFVGICSLRFVYTANSATSEPL
jgi:hypothetical protein